MSISPTRKSCSQTICSQECQLQAENTFRFLDSDDDIEATLIRVGVEFIKFLCRPEKASTARTVIAISERMPEIGRSDYESGAVQAIIRLAAYLKGKVKAGELAVDDCELAAAQLIEASQATLFKPLIFNFGKRPSEARIRHVVTTAVKTFLAAYRVR